MKRFAIYALGGLLCLVVVAGVAFLALRGLSADKILAAIERPPSPLLDPLEALEAFRVAPGFRIELVAAEPLVVDPVAMDWDDAGRLYVVEMRGYMRDLDAAEEERPSGRIVVLEDEDGDGRMDTSRVFADGLVLPRAVAVLPEGVLIAEPPNLWRCRDTTGDGRCDEKRRVGAYADEGPNVEHMENGLLPGLDGWLYNAKSERRIRLAEDGLEIEAAPFRGQWGIAQDDEGRLFYNHNSGFLYGEVFPGEYAMRQAATAARSAKPGLNVSLWGAEQVWGVRVAPGLNRAYVSGTLRRDGRQNGPTAVSGLAIQRGDQYGEAFRGAAFVPEPGSNVVALFEVESEDSTLRGVHRLYPDADWEQREFLASTDERFRPVDARVGPDGAIWLIDMYRGLIQHVDYVSDYLHDYVEAHDLAPPGAHGRIWRIVREDRPIAHRPPPLQTRADQLAALDHPNGWVRDRAQRRLIAEADPAALAPLRALGFASPLGRLHGIWTLALRGELDTATWERALADPDARVRRAALRAGEPRLASEPAALPLVLDRMQDADALVRLQALHSLGAVPMPGRPLAELVRAGWAGGALERQAAISSLAGLEAEALDESRAQLEGAPLDDASRAWLGELAGAVHRAAQLRPDAASEVVALLDRIAGADAEAREVMLEGIVRAQRAPGARRVELERPHPIFETDAGEDGALARVRTHLTWPGDLRPGGARALTPEEEALRRRGEDLYAATCASCHGAKGVGAAGLAPSLVGSPWVRDADDWAVRIVLHGLTGPLRLDGVDWDLTMPGHAHDPRFDDAGVASVLTFLRRSWGHGEDPVAPETVAAIRDTEAGRSQPWTVETLRALDVGHRLDRYVGTFAVSLMPVSFDVGRVGGQLTLGRGGAAMELDELGRHTFAGEGMMLFFEEDESGRIERARVEYQGTPFRISRKD